MAETCCNLARLAVTLVLSWLPNSCKKLYNKIKGVLICGKGFTVTGF